MTLSLGLLSLLAIVLKIKVFCYVDKTGCPFKN